MSGRWQRLKALHGFDAVLAVAMIVSVVAGVASLLGSPWSQLQALLLGWMTGGAMAAAGWLIKPETRISSRRAFGAVLEITLSLFSFFIVLMMLDADGPSQPGWKRAFWCFVIAAWLQAWLAVSAASRIHRPGRLIALAIPALFGISVLFLWEAIVRGANIPFVLLPPPSAIGAKFMASLPILAADFNQTVMKAVLFGFAAGSLAGFLVAVLADRYRFLANALLPVGNMVSALPIIGIAPIMVIWFGFDWFSKAAVVIVMTFFPMLVNTLAGLASTGRIERDLMQTYAAGHWQTLFKLRLPNAMPFIFNALKINSTLAMIGAIVAEFFGTPVVGMGFRISTEVGRMNLDMVWAEIALAALTGSAFYGLLTLIERATTFWHPSYRNQP